jgi:hypothetical protein
MQRVRDDISSTVTHFLNLHEALTSAANNTCVATRALLFKKTDELIGQMTDIWQVARKHLSECPPLPATRCESQREHFSECDNYLNANFDENDDTHSDDSDTE